MLQACPGPEGSPPPALPSPSPSAFAGLTPEAVQSQANPIFDDHMEEATQEATQETTSNPPATASSTNWINTNADLAQTDLTAEATGDVSTTADGSSHMSSSVSQPDCDPTVTGNVSSNAKTGSAVAQKVLYSTSATPSADPANGADVSTMVHELTARPGFATTASTAYTPSADPTKGADTLMTAHDMTARPGFITPASTGRALATPDKQSTADLSGTGLQSHSSTEQPPKCAAIPANNVSTAVARGQPDTTEAHEIKARAVKRVLRHPASQQTSGVAPCSTLAVNATGNEARSDDWQGSSRASHRPLTDTCNVLQQQAASAPETVDPPVNRLSAPVNATGVNL